MFLASFGVWKNHRQGQYLRREQWFMAKKDTDKYKIWDNDF